MRRAETPLDIGLGHRGQPTDELVEHGEPVQDDPRSDALREHLRHAETLAAQK